MYSIGIPVYINTLKIVQQNIIISAHRTMYPFQNTYNIMVIYCELGEFPIELVREKKILK